MIIHKIYWLRPNAIAQQPTKGIKYNEQLLLRINPFFDPTLVTISARFESLSLTLIYNRPLSALLLRVVKQRKTFKMILLQAQST